MSRERAGIAPALFLRQDAASQLAEGTRGEAGWRLGQDAGARSVRICVLRCSCSASSVCMVRNIGSLFCRRRIQACMSKWVSTKVGSSCDIVLFVRLSCYAPL